MKVKCGCGNYWFNVLSEEPSVTQPDKKTVVYECTTCRNWFAMTEAIDSKHKDGETLDVGEEK